MFMGGNYPAVVLMREIFNCGWRFIFIPAKFGLKVSSREEGRETLKGVILE